MVRGILSAVLLMAFEASALTMPFMHAHSDEHASAHHAPHAVHTHFATHEAHHTHSAGPVVSYDLVLSDGDDRPVYLDLFVAVGAQPVPTGGTALTVFDLPMPAETPAFSSVPVVHGHDPPLSDSLAPRAPPAFLS